MRKLRNLKRRKKANRVRRPKGLKALLTKAKVLFAKGDVEETA